MSEIKCCGAITLFTNKFEHMGRTFVFAFPHGADFLNPDILTMEGMKSVRSGYDDINVALHDIANRLLEAITEHSKGEMDDDEFERVCLIECSFASIVSGKKYWVMDISDSEDQETKEMELISTSTEKDFRELVAIRGEPITWM